MFKGNSWYYFGTSLLLCPGWLCVIVEGLKVSCLEPAFPSNIWWRCVSEVGLCISYSGRGVPYF